MKEQYQEFRQQIQGLNQALQERYSKILNMDSLSLKEKVKNLGEFHQMEILREDHLKEIGPLVGVDGSTVRLGGAHPHYVEIFQGLAKSTAGGDIFRQRLYTPLLETGTEEEGTKIHNKFLAQVEIEAAIGAVEELSPRVIIMDGGLLRYKINSEEMWSHLEQMCIDEDILICGAIKDIKTHMVSEALGYGTSFFDREFFQGKLNRGEIFIVDEEENTKIDKGFASAFYRPSNHNEVVGIDVLIQQKDHLLELCQILYTLTPRESRGVPLWIDIVDRECKLTPATLKALLEENMDRGLMERFFVSERDRRN